MHQTLICVVINCMTNKDMTNGRIPCVCMCVRAHAYVGYVSVYVCM